jgi:hypothetical protein
MKREKMILAAIPFVFLGLFAFFVFRKKEYIQIDTLKKKAFQIGNEVRWTAGNLKFGKVYEVLLLKDSNVIKTVQSKFTAVSEIMNGSFVISGIEPGDYKLALVSDNKILDAADLIVMPITPIQPPPPPPGPPPPQPPPPISPYDLILQVQKGINFDLKFYGEGPICNPKNPITYTTVKKESTNYYDWHYIKVNKPNAKYMDYAYLHIKTNGIARKVMPPYPPSNCNGIQAFSITINYNYAEYMSITEK